MTEPVKDQEQQPNDQPQVLDDDAAEAAYEADFQAMVDKREAEKTGEPAPVKEEEPPKAAERAAKKAEPKKEEKEAQAPPALSDDELLALVPEDRREAVKARLEQEQSTIQRLDQANRANAGRISAYQRRYEEAVGKRPVEAAKAASAEQLKDWSEIEKDYPDIAKGIKQLFESRGGNPNEIKNLVEFVEEEKRTRFLNEAYDSVEAVHPGWRDVVKTDEFKGWVKTSPAYEKLASSNDIADAVMLLDQWNYHVGSEAPAADPEQAAEAEKLAARREAQTRGAKTARGRAASPNQDVDPSDEDQLFAFYSQKANERMRNRYKS